jgi:hypothetical protein
MPHDRSPPDPATHPDDHPPDDDGCIEWEVKWTRKNRADHLLFVPPATERESVEEYIVVDPDTVCVLSEWR